MRERTYIPAEFFAELVFVKNRSRGAGASGKKYNPGRMSYEIMLKKKQSVITIKNKDKLCCARAIVTKAKADQDPQYHNIMHGRRCQEHRAKTLHNDAWVLEGPCSLDEAQAILNLFVSGRLPTDCSRGTER